jgi:hypothetical protein
MGRALRPGEEVSWNLPPGVIHGPVRKTRKRSRGKDKLAAAPDKPEPGSVDSAEEAKPARKRSDKP